MIDKQELAQFIIRAKKATYVSGGSRQPESCRTASKDLAYQEGGLSYMDSYFGTKDFIGQEIVWQDQRPLWGMNYYGALETDEVPPGFIDFLMEACNIIPEEAPYRGPNRYARAPFSYQCRWEGDIGNFRGRESITLNNKKIYILRFHGGFMV